MRDALDVTSWLWGRAVYQSTDVVLQSAKLTVFCHGVCQGL